MSQTAPAIYYALRVGGGRAGLSAAFALARVSCIAMLFDLGEFRNYGANDMHTLLSRHGIDAEEFRAISRKQIEYSYPHIWFQQSKIVQLAHTEILPEYKRVWATVARTANLRAASSSTQQGLRMSCPRILRGIRRIGHRICEFFAPPNAHLSVESEELIPHACLQSPMSVLQRLRTARLPDWHVHIPEPLARALP